MALVIEDPGVATAALQLASMSRLLKVVDCALLRVDDEYKEGTKKMWALKDVLQDVLVNAMTDTRLHETSEVADKMRRCIGLWVEHRYFPRPFFIDLQCRFQMKAIEGMEEAFASL